MTDEEKKVAEIREKHPAADPKALDEFRAALGTRHEVVDKFLDTEDYKALPFLEQEFLRIQRDAIRAVLVAANLQAECIAQTTPKPEAQPAQ